MDLLNPFCHAWHQSEATNCYRCIHIVFLWWGLLINEAKQHNFAKGFAALMLLNLLTPDEEHYLFLRCANFTTVYLGG